MKEYFYSFLGVCQVQEIADQRKVLLIFKNIQTDKDQVVLLNQLSSLIEQIKIDFPQQRIISSTSTSKDELYHLLVAAGFKRETHFASSQATIEWYFPEFEEGTYGLNGCGG